MKSWLFSIATDGSNDRGDKLYPLVVRYSENGNARTKLLTLLECTERGTGENIAKMIVNKFDEKGIPWRNCIAFTTDNANE